MTEIEWWEYDDAAEMAAAVAGDIQFVIESALDARGAAVDRARRGQDAAADLPDTLGKAKLDWKKVVIIPGDERIVPLGDPLSATSPRSARRSCPRARASSRCSAKRPAT